MRYRDADRGDHKYAAASRRSLLVAFLPFGVISLAIMVTACSTSRTPSAIGMTPKNLTIALPSTTTTDEVTTTTVAKPVGVSDAVWAADASIAESICEPSGQVYVQQTYDVTVRAIGRSEALLLQILNHCAEKAKLLQQ